MLVKINKYLSKKIDALFPNFLNEDGNQHFLNQVLPNHLENLPMKARILDVGGGKQPFTPPSVKLAKNFYVVGLDIDENELARAPKLAYDLTVVDDICNLQQEYMRLGTFDLIICQSLLEHVEDTKAALDNLMNLLCKDGRLVMFNPSSNAPFTWLNRILPEGVKKKILFTLYPEAERDQGFKAFYNMLTPNKINNYIKQKYGGTVSIDFKLFYSSRYFDFFLPLYLSWKLTKLFGLIPQLKVYLAETFITEITKIK